MGLRPCSYCVYWNTALLLLQSQDNIMLTQKFYLWFHVLRLDGFIEMLAFKCFIYVSIPNKIVFTFYVTWTAKKCWKCFISQVLSLPTKFACSDLIWTQISSPNSALYVHVNTLTIIPQNVTGVLFWGEHCNYRQGVHVYDWKSSGIPPTQKFEITFIGNMFSCILRRKPKDSYY